MMTSLFDDLRRARRGYACGRSRHLFDGAAFGKALAQERFDQVVTLFRRMDPVEGEQGGTTVRKKKVGAQIDHGAGGGARDVLDDQIVVLLETVEHRDVTEPRHDILARAVL